MPQYTPVAARLAAERDRSFSNSLRVPVGPAGREVVGNQPTNGNQYSNSYAKEHDGVHRLVSFIPILGFKNNGQNEAYQEGNGSNNPNQAGTSTKEVTHKPGAHNELSETRKHAGESGMSLGPEKSSHAQTLSRKGKGVKAGSTTRLAAIENRRVASGSWIMVKNKSIIRNPTSRDEVAVPSAARLALYEDENFKFWESVASRDRSRVEFTVMLKKSMLFEKLKESFLENLEDFYKQEYELSGHVEVMDKKGKSKDFSKINPQRMKMFPGWRVEFTFVGQPDQKKPSKDKDARRYDFSYYPKSIESASRLASESRQRKAESRQRPDAAPARLPSGGRLADVEEKAGRLLSLIQDEAFRKSISNSDLESADQELFKNMLDQLADIIPKYFNKGHTFYHNNQVLADNAWEVFRDNGALIGRLHANPATTPSQFFVSFGPFYFSFLELLNELNRFTRQNPDEPNTTGARLAASAARLAGSTFAQLRMPDAWKSYFAGDKTPQTWGRFIRFFLNPNDSALRRREFFLLESSKLEAISQEEFNRFVKWVQKTSEKRLKLALERLGRKFFKEIRKNESSTGERLPIHDVFALDYFNLTQTLLAIKGSKMPMIALPAKLDSGTKLQKGIPIKDLLLITFGVDEFFYQKRKDNWAVTISDDGEKYYAQGIYGNTLTQKVELVDHQMVEIELTAPTFGDVVELLALLGGRKHSDAQSLRGALTATIQLTRHGDTVDLQVISILSNKAFFIYSPSAARLAAERRILDHGPRIAGESVSLPAIQDRISVIRAEGAQGARMAKKAMANNDPIEPAFLQEVLYPQMLEHLETAWRLRRLSVKVLGSWASSLIERGGQAPFAVVKFIEMKLDDQNVKVRSAAAEAMTDIYVSWVRQGHPVDLDYVKFLFDDSRHEAHLMVFQRAQVVIARELARAGAFNGLKDFCFDLTKAVTWEHTFEILGDALASLYTAGKLPFEELRSKLAETQPFNVIAFSRVYGDLVVRGGVEATYARESVQRLENLLRERKGDQRLKIALVKGLANIYRTDALQGREVNLLFLAEFVRSHPDRYESGQLAEAMRELLPVVIASHQEIDPIIENRLENRAYLYGDEEAIRTVAAIAVARLKAGSDAQMQRLVPSTHPRGGIADDEVLKVFSCAISGLGKKDFDQYIKDIDIYLPRRLKSKREYVRLAAVGLWKVVAVRKIQEGQPVDILVIHKFLSDPDPAVRAGVLDALSGVFTEAIRQGRFEIVDLSIIRNMEMYTNPIVAESAFEAVAAIYSAYAQSPTVPERLAREIKAWCWELLPASGSHSDERFASIDQRRLDELAGSILASGTVGHVDIHLDLYYLIRFGYSHELLVREGEESSVPGQPRAVLLSKPVETQVPLKVWKHRRDRFLEMQRAQMFDPTGLEIPLEGVVLTESELSHLLPAIQGASPRLVSIQAVGPRESIKPRMPSTLWRKVLAAESLNFAEHRLWMTDLFRFLGVSMSADGVSTHQPITGRILIIGSGMGKRKRMIRQMLGDVLPPDKIVELDIIHDHAFTPTVQADAVRMPFGDGTVDIIVEPGLRSNSVVTPEQALDILRESYRVLRAQTSLDERCGLHICSAREAINVNPENPLQAPKDFYGSEGFTVERMSDLSEYRPDEGHPTDRGNFEYYLLIKRDREAIRKNLGSMSPPALVDLAGRVFDFEAVTLLLEVIGKRSAEFDEEAMVSFARNLALNKVYQLNHPEILEAMREFLVKHQHEWNLDKILEQLEKTPKTGSQLSGARLGAARSAAANGEWSQAAFAGNQSPFASAVGAQGARLAVSQKAAARLLSVVQDQGLRERLKKTKLPSDDLALLENMMDQLKNTLERHFQTGHSLEGDIRFLSGEALNVWRDFASLIERIRRENWQFDPIVRYYSVDLGQPTGENLYDVLQPFLSTLNELIVALKLDQRNAARLAEQNQGKGKRGMETGVKSEDLGTDKQKNPVIGYDDGADALGNDPTALGLTQTPQPLTASTSSLSPIVISRLDQNTTRQEKEATPPQQNLGLAASAQDLHTKQVYQISDSAATPPHALDAARLAKEPRGQSPKREEIADFLVHVLRGISETGFRDRLIALQNNFGAIQKIQIVQFSRNTQITFKILGEDALIMVDISALRVKKRVKKSPQEPSFSAAQGFLTLSKLSLMEDFSRSPAAKVTTPFKNAILIPMGGFSNITNPGRFRQAAQNLFMDAILFRNMQPEPKQEFKTAFYLSELDSLTPSQAAMFKEVLSEFNASRSEIYLGAPPNSGLIVTKAVDTDFEKGEISRNPNELTLGVSGIGNAEHPLMWSKFFTDAYRSMALVANSEAFKGKAIDPSKVETMEVPHEFLEDHNRFSATPVDAKTYKSLLIKETDILVFRNYSFRLPPITGVGWEMLSETLWRAVRAAA